MPDDTVTPEPAAEVMSGLRALIEVDVPVCRGMGVGNGEDIPRQYNFDDTQPEQVRSVGVPLFQAAICAGVRIPLQ